MKNTGIALVFGLCLVVSGCSNVETDTSIEQNTKACEAERDIFSATGETLGTLDTATNGDAAIAMAQMARNLAQKAAKLATGDLAQLLTYESYFWDSLAQEEFPNEITDKIPDDFSLKQIEDICNGLGVNIRE